MEQNQLLNFIVIDQYYFIEFVKTMSYASWNYDQHKKHKVCRGPSNEHSCTVWL